MERTPDEKPGGLDTGPELRHDATLPDETTLPPTDAPRWNGRVWAAVLAVLVVGLLAYLLFTLL